MPRSGHVALAGAPNVGKSSLLNALVGAHLAIVSPRAQATRLPVVGLRTEGDVQLVLHDLPGLLDPAYLLQARMLGAAQEALGQMDLVLHLHPAAEAPAPAFAEVARMPLPHGLRVMTVYTKADRVTPAERARLAREALVVSTANPASIDALALAVGQQLPVREFLMPADDIGTQPLRFFVTEFVREAAFALLEDELPYAVAAEVEEFREAPPPVYIRVTLYVERESQKGIVLGRGGTMIRAIGTHARERISDLLGAPVYLDLWVKALPRWRRNPAALSRLGFPESAGERA